MRWRVLELPDGLETSILRSPQISAFPSLPDCGTGAPSVGRIRLVISLPKVDCNPLAQEPVVQTRARQLFQGPVQYLFLLFPRVAKMNRGKPI